MYYNLYQIAKDIIKSKSPKEYIKKVTTKKFVHGFYLINDKDLIEILEKAKSEESKDFIEKIKNKVITNYEICEEELNKKYEQSQSNYFDIGSQLINYEKAKVRYFYDEIGNIYFRAKDVCEILEYSNTAQAVLINVDKKNSLNFKSLRPSILKIDMGIEIQEDENTIYINESGLYSLILKSTKPKAKEFSEWVTGEVLPSIRKQGYYKLFKKFNLKEYQNKNCFYIFKGNKGFFKLGITKDIITRMNGHKSTELLQSENQITDIFVIENYNDLMEIERKIKEYIRINGLVYEYKSYTELFKESEYNNVIGKLKELILEIKIKKEMLETKKFILNNNQNLNLQNENLKLQNNINLSNEILNEIKNELKIIKNDLIVVKNKLSINQDNFEPTQKPQETKPQETKPNETKKCLDCSTKIAKKSMRCNFCENKRRFLSGENNINRPTYDQLLRDKKELKSNVKIGKKYNVSDVAVKKWFISFEKYNIN
jgi:prophage antirepressor-like protein